MIGKCSAKIGRPPKVSTKIKIKHPELEKLTSIFVMIVGGP
jgi:hypothetical protein